MTAIAAVKTIRSFHIDEVASTGLFGIKTLFKLNLTTEKVFVDKKVLHNGLLLLCMRPLCYEPVTDKVTLGKKISL